MDRIKIADVKISKNRRALRSIDTLAESVKELGLLNPITVTPDMQLVAGLHRLRACEQLGWVDIPALVVDLDEISARMAEIDENLIRNELSALERGEAIADRKRFYLLRHPETRQGGAPGDVGGGRGKRIKKDTVSVLIPSFSADTAQRVGVTERTVRRDAQIGNLPEPVREVLRGTVAENDKGGLLALARLRKEPAKQSAIAEAVASGKAKDITSALRDARLVEREEKIAEIARGDSPLDAAPANYPIIYADPPWRYEHAVSTSREIENQYPTMTLDEICALPVGKIATDDAILFLWATSPKLAEAMRVIEEWGFTYRTNAVWDKERIGMGYYYRQQHELLLVATRGDIPAPAPAARPSSVIRVRRDEKHSAKPEIVYEQIEAMYPRLPKLEMFCRTPRAGWGVWGNQAQ